MQAKTFNHLLGFSLFFLAHWFFGNLYEEIVLAPNQLANSYEALKSWQGYFTVTNQIYYYVPLTQIAVFVVCFLYVKSSNTKEKCLLKKASIFGLLSILITALIVTQLNLKLFFGDIEKYKEQIYNLSVIWLIGNAIRLYLVGTCLYLTFKHTFYDKKQ
ncbi:hypothetical protein [Chryseobacterium chendengshani]|uniref:hypothetical protein n=1 Tax=Chryseobacterium sp. LJ756 TaxID=2864113 RepID=UPI001C6406DA|nr:hypothetical protein [Chryseobacterium sp. LJ756]MBW7676688.1 hypothetical protein [Chryseobacterium sp. LJ756]